MKVKLLLCMMVLGLFGTAAQPRVTDNGLIKMPTPFPVLTKTITTESPTAAKRATKAKAGAIPVQVNVVLDFDADHQIVRNVYFINEEYDLSNDEIGVQIKKGSNILTVPSGTYDIMVNFQEVDWTQELYALHEIYVIRENVTINGETELDFAASEATNHVHFQTLTPEGEPVNTGKWTVDDNWTNWTEVEPGNTSDVLYSYTIINDYGMWLTHSGTFGQVIESGPHHTVGNEIGGDLFINDVSDRYAFRAYRMGYRVQSRECFTASYELLGGVSSDTSFTNNPADYAIFDKQYIVPNHQGENLYAMCWLYDIMDHDTGVSAYEVDFVNPLSEGEMCKYYLGASSKNSILGYHSYIEPSVATLKKASPLFPYQQDDYIPVLTSRITNDDGEIVYANNGIRAIYSHSKTALSPPDYGLGWLEEPDATGNDFFRFPVWSEFNPSFTFPVDKMEGTLGNNLPLLVGYGAQTHDIIGNEFEAMGIECGLFDYMGRFGERSEDWKKDTHIQVNVNGDDVFSGSPTDNITVRLNELISGNIDITYTNKEFTIDEMIGSNITKMHLSVNADEQCTPSITMLQFKTNSGIVTDRFTTANDGIMNFSAGDFNRHLTFPNLWVGYDRYAPETVEVSYSPYGEDNWNELAVEEVPENYWPVMGWFYTGSLAGVTGEALNGWFDLKIRLTDAAGNWQEQVLSPAFRIDDLAYSSVANVGSDNAHEVARYSLDGKRVDGNHRGVTIVKMSDGNARKVVR